MEVNGVGIWEGCCLGLVAGGILIQGIDRDHSGALSPPSYPPPHPEPVIESVFIAGPWAGERE